MLLYQVTLMTLTFVSNFNVFFSGIRADREVEEKYYTSWCWNTKPNT